MKWWQKLLSRQSLKEHAPLILLFVVLVFPAQQPLYCDLSDSGGYDEDYYSRTDFGKRILEQAMPIDSCPNPSSTLNSLLRSDDQMDHCVPIVTKIDETCRKTDRWGLFTQEEGLPCRTSVLDMILFDVYSTAYEVGIEPFLVYGSVLSAYRSNDIIWYTTDVDITGSPPADPEKQFNFEQTLLSRGFRVLEKDHAGFAVCITYNHPLAGRLMTRGQLFHRRGLSPYLDFYITYEITYEDHKSRKRQDAGKAPLWTPFGFRNQTHSFDTYYPLKEVSIYNNTYKTVNQIERYLEQEYGDSYMVERDWTGFNFYAKHFDESSWSIFFFLFFVISMMYEIILLLYYGRRLWLSGEVAHHNKKFRE